MKDMFSREALGMDTRYTSEAGILANNKRKKVGRI